MPPNTPGYAVRIETGCTPLSVHIFKRILNWLIKILEMDDERYPELCFNKLYKLVNYDSKYNWALQIRQIFHLCEREVLWNNLDASSLKENKFLLVEQYTRHLKAADQRRLILSSSLILYNNLNPQYCAQDYLRGGLPLIIKQTIANLRLSNKYAKTFKIGAIFVNLDSPNFCPKCLAPVPQSLVHILTICPF